MPTFYDKLMGVSLTMKYPDKTRYTLKSFIAGATEGNLLDVAEAMNSLQENACSDIIMSETSNLYMEYEM